MNILTTTISEREKAAIFFHVFGGCNDWHMLYKIASDDPMNKPKNKNFVTYVSRWKHSEKIQNYIAEVQRARALQEHESEQKGIENYLQRESAKGQESEKEHTENGRKRQIDYMRPENQRTLLNDLINTADDQKDKLDALKTIIQAQKDDRQAAKDNQIQRFYTPLKCHNCPLYQKSTK